MTKKAASAYLILIGLLLILVVGWYIASFLTSKPASVSFDSTRAYADVKTQVSFGPRIPETDGHAQIRGWLRQELEKAGWAVEIQQTERLGHPIYNIIAKRSDEEPQIVLGAHYDTRMIADNDPDMTKRTQPVPGANDGASGVAILVEMARSLPKDSVPVWLVFFDTEDNGNIDGWDWILGSRAFAEEIKISPRAVVIVDMIGDTDLNIYLERNSDIGIRTKIWTTAEKLGYGDKFIFEEKYSMEDDHTPFLEAGLPAVDLIDFDYPYWHTIQDTPDKVSPESLKAVGDTLWTWIVNQPPP
ncbi:MAG: M28 family peptidase [Chloroflexi bacterium]|nr:M28 family peptidase [Chloroflexota bacterium]